MTNGAEPRKPKALAVTLKYKDKQEHLLRRLGQAVVLHWDDLPDDIQDLLIDQAVVVHDPDDGRHEPGDFETFIRSVKTTQVES